VDPVAALGEKTFPVRARFIREMEEIPP